MLSTPEVETHSKSLFTHRHKDDDLTFQVYEEHLFYTQHGGGGGLGHRAQNGELYGTFNKECSPALFKSNFNYPTADLLN